MKKLMCAIGAAAIAGIAMADISSANIVGYNNVKVAGNKMNLLTISWESVGKDGKAHLKDIMSTDGLTSYTADLVPGDYIDTWDMANGNWGPTYFYINLPEFELPDQWIDDSLAPADIAMEPGSSFWLYHKGDTIDALPFAGQVCTGCKGYTLTGGKMNLCGNPYPALLDLNAKSGQVTITGATSYTEDLVPGDYIDTWGLTSCNWGPTYFYIDLPAFELPDQWIDASLAPASTDIQPGAGFWYFAKNPGVSLTFTEIK